MEDKKSLEDNLLKEKKVNKNIILNIVPELIICTKQTQKHPCHYLNVFDHIIESVNLIESDLILKLTMLLHDIGKPYVCKEIDGVEHFWGHEEKSEILARLVLQRLGYEQDIIDNVCILIRYHDKKFEISEIGIKEMINLIGKSNFIKLLKVKKADLMAHSQYQIDRTMPILSEIDAICRKIL